MRLFCLREDPNPWISISLIQIRRSGGFEAILKWWYPTAHIPQVDGQNFIILLDAGFDNMC
jgi:hypothetical protein